MAEDTQLAFVQNALSVAGANAPLEGSALQNELFRRLLVSGIQIDASGNITATALITTTSNVSNATGTLAVAHGGSGTVTLTAHGVVVGNGTSAVAVTGAGTSGQLLTSNGAAADPTFQTLTVPLSALANLGTTTTVLHGNAAGNPSFGAVVEADLTLAANTTNDVTTARHGFAPILPNDVTKFLDGTGAYSVPASGAGFDLLQIEAML